MRSRTNLNLPRSQGITAEKVSHHSPVFEVAIGRNFWIFFVIIDSLNAQYDLERKGSLFPVKFVKFESGKKEKELFSLTSNISSHLHLATYYSIQNLKAQ